MAVFKFPFGWKLRWTKFLYVLAAPIIASCKWPQLRMTTTQFIKMAIPRGDASAIFQRIFTTSGQMLPDALKRELTPKRLTTTYKSAGTLSNQRSAAATAWLVKYYGQLEKLPNVWAGLVTTFFYSKLLSLCVCVSTF